MEMRPLLLVCLLFLFSPTIAVSCLPVVSTLSAGSVDGGNRFEELKEHERNLSELEADLDKALWKTGRLIVGSGALMSLAYVIQHMEHLTHVPAFVSLLMQTLSLNDFTMGAIMGASMQVAMSLGKGHGHARGREMNVAMGLGMGAVMGWKMGPTHSIRSAIAMGFGMGVGSTVVESTIMRVHDVIRLRREIREARGAIKGYRRKLLR